MSNAFCKATKRLTIHEKQHSTLDAGVSTASPSPSPSSRFQVVEFQYLTQSFALIAPFGLPAAVISVSAH
jgi:hypothetical protein